MPSTTKELPTGFRRVIWEEKGYAFTAPEDAQFVQFNHEGTLGILRILIDTEDTHLRFNVERLPDEMSMQAAADAAYEGAVEAFEQENVPPMQIPRDKITIWRCRKRFVEGATAPLIIDKAFIDIGNRKYSIGYVVPPMDYNKGVHIFETLLMTFQSVEE
jgi:hypothetical protein